MKNFEELMKAAQAMQAQMMDSQGRLDQIEVEGQAGAGLVKVRASAKGKIIRVSIDPSLMQADDREMLEDLLAAAINDARARGEARAQQEMAKLTQGLPLPPGFKMPF